MTQNSLAGTLQNQECTIAVWQADRRSLLATGIAFCAGFSVYLGAIYSVAHTGQQASPAFTWLGIVFGCAAFALLAKARPVAHSRLSTKFLAIVPVGAFCAARLVQFAPVHDLIGGILNLQ